MLTNTTSFTLVSSWKFILSFIVILLNVQGGIAQMSSDYKFIDISNAVNQGFLDEEAGDGHGGWTDFGSDACFRKITFGEQFFDDGVIPFNIIDPTKNNGKSVLVLSGPKREDNFPAASQRIYIKGKFSSLHFLHTTMYAKKDAGGLVKYKIHYKDNSEEIFTCYNKIEIADWWEPSELMPAAIRTYEESNRWMINTPWKNPYPDKRMEWIKMESTGNAIPILIAITAAKDPKIFEQITAVFNARISQYEQAYLNIASLQIRSQNDQQWNLEKGNEFCREAKAKGADIALFPEMYNLGYHGIDFYQANALEKWKTKAVSQESDFVKHFKELAKELEMAIVITYLEDIGDNQLPRNSASLIDRHGEIVFTYSKVHTCEFAHLENSTTPGEGFFVHELDTKAGLVKIGIMICYDREAPESARILMLNGAEIILTPNACDLEELRLAQFRVRAFENAVVTVMANYGSMNENKRFNGHSCIYNANGQELMMAGSEEGVYMGTVNLYDIRHYREETIWGNAFRRPHKYKMLVSPEVDSVFRRKDSFGNEFKSLER